MNAGPAAPASVPPAEPTPPGPARRVLTVRESLAAIVRLASGSAGAQAIQFGSALILARLLEPAVFGEFAVFLGYGAILTAVGGLKLEQAIQLQATEARARVFATSALAAGALFAVGLSLLFAAAAGTGWLPGGRAWRTDWVLALPIYAWTGLAARTVTAWRIRQGRFPAVARLRWAMAAGTAALQLGGAALGLGTAGQVWGASLGLLAGVAAAAGAGAVRAARAAGRGRVTSLGATTIAALAEWRPRGVDLVLAGLLNNVAWQIPPVLLNQFWGATLAGYYALSFRVAIAPLDLCSSALADVAYRETTLRLQAGSGLRAYVWRSTLGLLAGAGLAAAGAALAGPPLVPLVFGARWEWVARLLPWMMLPFVFRLTGTALALFTQTGRTRLLLSWQAAFLLAQAVCFVAAHAAHWGLLGVTIAAALVQSGFYLVMIGANLALAAAQPARPA